jgi:uncharacterized protein (TIGR02147 family)
MDIFSTRDYRKFLASRLEALPRKGYGQAGRLAAHLRVSNTLVSQVLHGHKHLTTDQAFAAAEFLVLHELETRYFLGLVQWERAGNAAFRRHLDRELAELREQSRKVEHRLTHEAVLSEEQKAEFYSEWYFSAIRMLTSIPGQDTPDAIQRAFALPPKVVQRALRFLAGAGLVVEGKGHYRIGPRSTHVGADSRWVKLHHRNWRNQAVHDESGGALHYTSPMTLSRTDAEKVREKLLRIIEEVGKTVDDSPSEELHCFNLDWFKVWGQNDS